MMGPLRRHQNAALKRINLELSCRRKLDCEECVRTMNDGRASAEESDRECRGGGQLSARRTAMSAVDVASIRGLSADERSARYKLVGLKMGERLRLENKLRQLETELPAIDLSDHNQDDSGSTSCPGAEGWPDVYYVVHEPRVAVRAAPSVAAKLVGARAAGSQVIGTPTENGWLKLFAPTLDEEDQFILIDGAHICLPRLLEYACSSCAPLEPLGGREKLVPPAANAFGYNIMLEAHGRPSGSSLDFKAGRLPGLPLEPPPLLHMPLRDGGSFCQQTDASACARLAVRTLARRGFCLCSTALSPQLLAAARQEMEELNASGALQAGHIAGDVDPRLQGHALFTPEYKLPESERTSIRSDHCTFLSHHLHGLDFHEKAPPPDATHARDGQYPALVQLQSLLNDFGSSLGAQLGGGPRDVNAYPMRFASEKAAPPAIRGHSDMQCSCYRDRTSKYNAHVDNAGGAKNDGRIISMILYLNDDEWADLDGGALRVYLPEAVAELEGLQPASRTPFVDVQPSGGTLCIFRSDRVWHSVQPPRRPRFALTVWLLAHDPPEGSRQLCYF